MVVAATGRASGRDSTAHGLALAALGGFLLSFDVPLLKLAHADMPTLATLRGVLLFLSMWLFWFIVRRPSGQPFVNGYTAVQIAVLSGLSNLAVLTAITHTTVANVVFILAFNPLFGAFLSFLLMGERPSVSTVIAIAAAVFGVALIVGNGLVAGTWFGDLCALTSAVVLGLILTLARRSGQDHSLSPAFGSLLASALMVFFANPMALTPEGAGFLALNGLLVMPLSSALLYFAPKLIPAAVVGMFYLIETATTPLWMWLIFGEVPPVQSIAGGSIIMAALIGDSAWKLARRG
ncbi:MAG: DMT family transporter [Hyphomicrobiales bacterium]